MSHLSTNLSIFFLFLVWSALRIRADEEVPLRHASATVTRNRTLQDIINKLHLQIPPNEKDGVEDFESCQHLQLEDYKVPLDQVKRFENSTRVALKLSNLLNALYLSVTAKDSNARHRNSRNLTASVLYYPPAVIEAVVRDALDSEPRILSLGVAFVRNSYFRTSTQSQHFGVLGWRNRLGKILVGDLARIYGNSYDDSQVPGTRWFTEILYR